MTLSHSNDGQDENINVSDEKSKKRDDPKEISAIGIGNSAEGRLIPVIISSHNHEAEVDDGTSNENGDGLLERQRSDNLENGKTVLKRDPVHWDPLGHEKPKPEDITTISNNPGDQPIDQGSPVSLTERNFLKKSGGEEE
jgi:hypothetical protein